jgi:uncharacterized protein (TIGR02147 family)
MNVFKALDYKQALREAISENRAEYGYKTKLAEAAGCQKSFLSQVLNSHVDLTVDHAVALSNFWKLDTDAAEYFVDLLLYARAGTEPVKLLIKRRLDRAKSAQEHLGKRFKQPELKSTESSLLYYSSWHYAAVHILLTVPGYRTVPALMRRLQLPEEVVAGTLESLRSMGLARQADRRWEATSQSVHLSNDSPLYSINLGNWRNRALTQSHARRQDDVFYSGIYSMTQADFERLRQMLFAFIENSRSLVISSKEEDVFCFNCDLFAV